MLLVILGAALGILLLLLGSFNGVTEEAKEESGVTPNLDPTVYAEQVEAQVVALCSRVKGAGTVSAVVTLEGGYRAVYASDSQSSTSGYKSSTVLVGSGSSEGAVLVCYENPEIAGIGIVCSGAVNEEVKVQIISLVSATFRIGSNRIFVASGVS